MASSATRIGTCSAADIKGVAVQVVTGRWLMVLASFLLMVTAGASYMFGLYSNDIKSVLGYDQTTLNLISFFKDLGANIGILSGLINEVTPPWVVLSIGAILNFVGNFMIWLAVSRKIKKPQVWHMCSYIAIGANSHTFTNTGALGYTGISAAVLAQVYRAFYGENTKAFTLFVAWLPTALSFVFIRTIRIIRIKNRPKNEVKVFYKFLYASLGLAGFLLMIIILEKKFSFTQPQYGASASVVLFLLFLPLAIVVSEEFKLWKSKRSGSREDFASSPVKIVTKIENPIENSSSTTQKKDQDHVSWCENVFNPPEIGEDFTILQALFSVEMLTLLLATISGIGGMMTMMDNLGQIGTSFGYPLKKISSFVSLTSIWCYLGQVTLSILSEVFITKYKCPRPLFLTLILVLACAGHLLIAFNVPNGLYVASVLIGFSFGAIWPLIFTIISELFGLKYYSTLYNFGGAASPIGLYLLNVKVTGYYYDEEAKKQLASLGKMRKPGEALNCFGGECFRLSFIIITVVTFFGALVSLVLVLRTRKFYSGDIYKKFRVAESPEIAMSGRELGVEPAESKVVENGTTMSGNDQHLPVAVRTN
ncbi:hypothetical protein UlMin_026007 [Ulmus minor]